MYDLLIRGGRLVSSERIYNADVAITDGKYAAFLSPGTVAEAKEIIEADGKYVFSGIVDCHAHLNEPGFEYREEFETGSRAAVAAGCTCLIDMPLNNDPSLVNKDVFDLKMSKIQNNAAVDFALWGGVIGDYDDGKDRVKNNVDALVDLHKCGVAAFKAFTCPTGPLFPPVNLGIVKKAMETLKPYNALCGFHCEEYGLIDEGEKDAKNIQGCSNSEKIRNFLDVHDVWSELVATKNILDMVRATGARTHICHVSHPMVAEEVKKAIYEGLPVTAETCPHYLGFTEDFVFEKGVPAKCTPPMRKKEDMEKLWSYVLDGTLSCIGSDHSPAADEEKDNSTKDIWSAWGGLNSIQFFLPMMFDLMVHQKKLSPTWIAKTMCHNPSKVFGLYGQKGAFEIGFDGDIVIVDPEKPWVCKQEELYTKGHTSCFDGLSGKGCATHTIIRGKTVAKNGCYTEEAVGHGRFVRPITETE